MERGARRLISLAVVALIYLLPAPLTYAAAAPMAGLPPGLTDVPLPGVAGEAARRARTSQVRFVSPAHISVAARRDVPIELHFEVIGGFHINSHTPRDKSLIPTRLTTRGEKQVRLVSVHFPPGDEYSPSFAPKEKMSVYSGDFAVRTVVRAEPGRHIFKAALHYQACDVNSCLPPRSLPVEIVVEAK